MKHLLAKLGQNPRHSLTIFLRGIGLFVLSILFIGLGYFYHHLWQLVGILLLIFACAMAAWGYLGIFANRWFNILNRTRTRKTR